MRRRFPPRQSFSSGARHCQHFSVRPLSAHRRIAPSALSRGAGKTMEGRQRPYGARHGFRLPPMDGEKDEVLSVTTPRFGNRMEIMRRIERRRPPWKGSRKRSDAPHKETATGKGREKSFLSSVKADSGSGRGALQKREIRRSVGTYCFCSSVCGTFR